MIRTFMILIVHLLVIIKKLVKVCWFVTTKGVTLKSYWTFIHLVVCLTTGPKPLPKRALHIVRSKTSSFKWEYHLLFLRSSSCYLRLLPRLPFASIPPFIFPSITCCRKQSLRNIWPIQFSYFMHTGRTT
jgi:hypothetical protein